MLKRDVIVLAGPDAGRSGTAVGTSGVNVVVDVDGRTVHTHVSDIALDDRGMVGRAASLAAKVHAGQTDKAGQDYIHHPRRVAARMLTPEGQAVGWLHDVLEDSDTTVGDLHAAGFPDTVIDAVVAMTKVDGETLRESMARVAVDPLARRVKMFGDVADNADEARLSLLPDDVADRLRTKYARTLDFLNTPTEDQR